MKVYLVTKNQGKLLAARSAFSKTTTIELLPVEKDYPEIQASTSLEVAKYTAVQVAWELKAPAIREDHSFFLNALGLPGPYMNYFNRILSPAKLLRLLSAFDDRTGYFEVATVYAEPNGHTKEYVFQVPFSIVEAERGEGQSGINRLIQLDGETRTLAEYPETERTHIWGQNYSALVKDLGAE
jgi:XTP/dITP diphosphohydrolase